MEPATKFVSDLVRKIAAEDPEYIDDESMPKLLRVEQIGNDPAVTEAVPRPELDAKLATVRADTLAAGAELRADFAGLRADFAGLRTDIEKFRGDFTTRIESVRTEIHQSTADSIKWMVGVTISVVAVAVAILTFVIHNAQRKEAPAAAPTIIVNVPSAAPAASAPAK